MIPRLRVMRFDVGRIWGKRSLEETLHTLGSLEKKLLEQIWEQGEVSVQDLRQQVPDLAYTTLMTTADRLYKKGVLHRRKDGRAFRYSPAVTRAEFSESVTRHLVGLMLRDAGTAPVGIFACFVDAVTERDAQLLQQLEQMVAEKRRQNQARGQA